MTFQTIFLIFVAWVLLGAAFLAALLPHVVPLATPKDAMLCSVLSVVIAAYAGSMLAGVLP